MHALLFRNWKSRVKGRDWYDLEWYVRKGVQLNLSHFVSRAQQSGHFVESQLSEQDFRQQLKERIDSLDVTLAQSDVSRFVGNADALKIWSREYFHQLAQRIIMSRG